MRTFLFLVSVLASFTSFRATAQTVAAPYAWTSRSVTGSESSGVDSRFWQTGLLSGYFNLSYDFYSIPDSMVVTFGGTTVFSTGGYVSGAQTVSVFFGPVAAGANTLLNVVVNPQGPRPGTGWDYTLTPTAKPTVTSLRVSGRSGLDENSSGTFFAEASYSTGSTRIVVAQWSSSSPVLSIGRVGMDVRVTANAVTSSTNAILTARYTEDGVTVTRDLTVSVADRAISGNSTALQGIDPNGRGDSSVGGPVDTATGAENFARTLHSLSGLRDFDFIINYNSLQTSTAGDLGFGWTHPWLATASETTSSSDSTVTIRWSPNRSHGYVLVRSTFGAYFACADEAAQYDTLVKTADNGFILTKPDQTTYVFSPSGLLVEVANRRGQKLTVSGSSSQLTSIVEPVSGARLTFTYASNRIATIADSASQTVGLAYNSAGLLSEITDARGNKTTYSYDVSRRLASVTAADGVVIYRNTYDATGRVATQDDGLDSNQLARFAYDETTTPGRVVTTVTNRGGASTVYAHDGLYRMVSIRDPLGNATSFTYDAAGQRTETRDALGRLTRATYDIRGNLLTVTDPDSKTATFTYDAKNNLLSVSNADGKTSSYVYDARNNVIEAIDAAGNKTTRTYDAASNLTRETSPRGSATTFTYTNGRVASRTDPLGNRVTYAYDAAGRLTGITDPSGGVQSFSYSATGRIVENSNPLGQKTTYAYDVRDRLVTVTDPLGGVTRTTYDANNNVRTRTDALNGITRFEYDGEDRPTRITDARGNTSTLAYDAAGRLTAFTDALGNRVGFAYDAVRNRTSITDALGNTINQTTYDVRDLPTAVRDALNRTRTNVFDAIRGLVRESNALGQSINYSYDPLGRVIQSTDALGQSTRQTYDSDGNRVSLINPADAATAFSYDAANNVTGLTTPGGRKISYTYESRGLLASTTKPSNQATTRTYDRAGRLTRASDPVGNIDYAYDAKNRLVSVTENNRSITRTYDALDRMTSVTDRDGNRLSYEYDLNGNLTSLTYPDGKRVSYGYDAANRLTKVTDWAARVTDYAYDANSRLIRTSRPNGTVETREYDRAGQLVLIVDRAQNGSLISQTDFAYDVAGRILSENRTPAAAGYVPNPATFTYDNDNRLATYAGQAIAHDADGNMLRAPVSGGTLVTLAYDARDRLTTAGSSNYAYDAENRRVQTTTSGGTTRLVVNPHGLLSQLLVSTPSVGGVTRYVYGLGLIYQETDTTVRYLHYDYRGSTIALTGGNGAVLGRVDYSPFGEIVNRTGDTNTSFLFVGRAGVESDQSGLAYMRARYYAPVGMRFVSADPIGFAGGINWYAYANGNPVGFVDPSGLDAIVEIGYTQAAGYGVHGRYHTFVLITDTETGRQFVTRAGPSAGGLSGSGSTSGSSASGGSVSGTLGGGSSGGIGFGSVYADTGLYQTHPRDNPDTTVRTQRVGVVEADFDAVIKAARAFEQITNRNKITYTPLGGGVSGLNSNSYTGTFIESLGFSRPPLDLSAPGFQYGKASPDLPYYGLFPTYTSDKR